MKGLTLHEAFERLISQPMWWAEIAANAQRAAEVKNNFKNDLVSEKKMRKILEQKGYRKVQNELWSEA